MNRDWLNRQNLISGMLVLLGIAMISNSLQIVSEYGENAVLLLLGHSLLVCAGVLYSTISEELLPEAIEKRKAVISLFLVVIGLLTAVIALNDGLFGPVL